MLLRSGRGYRGGRGVSRLGVGQLSARVVPLDPQSTTVIHTAIGLVHRLLGAVVFPESDLGVFVRLADHRAHPDVDNVAKRRKEFVHVLLRGDIHLHVANKERAQVFHGHRQDCR